MNSNAPDRLVTMDEALDAAAETYLRGLAEQAARTPRAAAEAAWYPGHPAGSVDALEVEICERRARQNADRVQAPAA